MKRIAELEAKLRAWEETAEYYCAADTPISADGVRGYIAELNAKLAAANQRIADQPHCDSHPAHHPAGGEAAQARCGLSRETTAPAAFTGARRGRNTNAAPVGGRRQERGTQ